MSKEKPFVDRKSLLKKFPGKGGWTYTEVPEIKPSKMTPFGWVTVKGFIDDHELKHYKLMPMGNGSLFLPVKAQIRKKLKKQAGDFVHVTLYVDDSSVKIPEEIMECFELEPKTTFKTFQKFTEGERKAYLDWIYAAKKEETKANRILNMMNKLEKGLKLYDKE